jgi:streptomycin 6-kinase
VAEVLPASVLAMGARGPAWEAWVRRLPALAREVQDEWRLRPDGPPTSGHCSLVVPVRDEDDRPAVLKLGFPEPDSEHEHLALHRWAGRGAVRLSRADPRRRALLLDRLGPHDLDTVDDEAACVVVAGLYGLLHMPASPQLRRLSALASRQADRLQSLPRDAAVPHRLVEQAASLARALAEDPRTDGTLLHTDLHGANVLAAPDGAWLAIDPKPLSGDPHYEPAPLLWNRWSEAGVAGSLRDGVRRRFHAVVDAAGLDEDRARAWVVLRTVVNAVDALEAASADRDWVTVNVTVAKAVQD